ncbi:signal transduction histidine-protein kinase/phosphatase DegS [Siminovitchia terrae]|uniref:Signal transduction histidine-protein kinase/phosphatase DegS n=1 Tax=Siminovitchia terrae TaxID=1914933 RepID=A0A429X645_SIMTE|nr:sensor histidine kinase [Siminovitchia terrae]RST58849.1 sensor histidine kinase [Siminovitchia terrae]GIN89278.1 signal transduction histidine-protein kinase/phosphatase DegS [Siminovitchia terrae]GIN95342.1 signal transduction histidine-protein kinase/phosphatase DegS [Siminovitchia terrae]
MALKKVNIKALDNIVEQMINTVDRSKHEIFQIGEQCRHDHDNILKELEKIKAEVNKVIDEGDLLEVQSRISRQRLSTISLHFKEYSEEQVRTAYEQAHDLQSKLMICRQLEKQLRERRDDLERRLLILQQTIERAETLVSQISIVSNYLVSDIKEMGEALEDAKMKQDFGLRIIEAQEEERKRLSREIHDGPAQLLASVLIRSDLAEKMHKEEGPERSLEEIRSLKEMIRTTLYEVRRIIYDLRPMALDDLGLIPTLTKYLATVEEYHKTTNIEFVYFGKDTRLPQKYEVALFRLIQEAVHNALKHAQSRTIQVKVEIQSEHVYVIVKDDGIGFDVNVKKSGSYGMMGMRERVEILDGLLSIHSKQGAGTVISIKIPVALPSLSSI